MIRVMRPGAAIAPATSRLGRDAITAPRNPITAPDVCVAAVNIRIPGEIIVVVDIYVVVPPTAAPAPAPTPERSHRHTDTERKSHTRRVVSSRWIVDRR